MAKLQMKQKTAADYFDDFIRVKKALGAAKDTIDIYNDCWKRFEGFLQDDYFPIEEINSNLIIQYIEYLSEANIKPASINHNLKHIKAYCLWLKCIALKICILIASSKKIQLSGISG